MRGQWKLNYKSKYLSGDLGEIVQRIVRNEAKSGQAGKQMDAHQTNVHGQGDSNAVSGKRTTAPAEQYDRSNGAHCDLYRKKRAITDIEQAGHQLVTLRRNTTAYPDNCQKGIQKIECEKE